MTVNPGKQMNSNPSAPLKLLDLETLGGHRYRGLPELEGDIARNVVFGGQILAQMIMAAHLDRSLARGDGQQDEKEVKSIHAIFARAGDYHEPIEYDVERMHDGRTLGSDSVNFSQTGKVMSRGLILWSKSEPDLIIHTENVAMPDVPDPDDVKFRPDFRAYPGAEVRIVDDIDTWNEAQPIGPALQNVWTRLPGTSGPPVVHQAILSWATDGFLIGTSMLPHAEYSEGQAHRTISTGVVSHTVNFHERFDASKWLLMANESIWAGRGRTHGRSNVWTRDGRLVATYTQDNLIRGFADRHNHHPKGSRRVWRYSLHDSRAILSRVRECMRRLGPKLPRNPRAQPTHRATVGYYRSQARREAGGEKECRAAHPEQFSLTHKAKRTNCRRDRERDRSPQFPTFPEQQP